MRIMHSTDVTDKFCIGIGSSGARLPEGKGETSSAEQAVLQSVVKGK